MSALPKSIAYQPQGRRPISQFSRRPNPGRPPRRPSSGNWRNWIGRLAGMAGIAFGAGVVVLAVLFVWYSRDLPDPTNLSRRALSGATRIYDRTGETVLYEVHGDEKRIPVKLDDLPPYIEQATLTAEDRDFYKHRGFDITGILRAIYVDIINRDTLQGGSTITQQLVKTTIVGGEKTLPRKIKELILAYRIEQRFEKRQIVELYLNSIPYGSTAYGIEAAANLYFKKPAKDLTLAEAATLAGLAKAPSKFSPYGNNKDRLIERQQYILSEMAKLGYITQEQAEAAKKEELKFSPIRSSIIAPHFVFYIKELLAEKYGEEEIETGGYKIITTLDLYKQKIAEEEVTAGAERNEKKYKASNAALVSLDPKTGQILAMVGSRDYFNEEFGNVNVALRPRQPGSSFKPIVYAAAFMRGFTPDTPIYDVLTTFKTGAADYKPLNYDGSTHGRITMRQALAGSLNIPAVKTLYLTGIDFALDAAEKMGYTTLADRSRYGLSLVLGGGEVTLLEHTAAFQAFAREGEYHEPTGILRVEDASGKVLEEYRDNPETVLAPNAARQVTSILTDNAARAYVFGANSPLQLGARPVGAKTGTTNDWRDGWTMGFTPSLVTGVWAGNNSGALMARGADGVLVAAPIWNAYMKRVLGETPIEQFRAPDAVPLTNPYLQGQVPAEEVVIVDKITGKRATDLTPPEYREERRYPAAHSELYYVDRNNPTGPAPEHPEQDPNFASWEAAVQAWRGEGASEDGEQKPDVPPTETDDVHTEANIPSLLVTSPVANGTVRGQSLSVSLVASAPRGITSIAFFIDGAFIGEATASGTYTLNLPAGLAQGFHALKVEAKDDVGNTKVLERTFNYIP